MAHRFFRFGDQSILLLNSSPPDILFCSQSMFNFNSNIDIWSRGSLQKDLAFFLTASSPLRTWTETIVQLAFTTMGADWQTDHLYTERNFSITLVSNLWENDFTWPKPTSIWLISGCNSVGSQDCKLSLKYDIINFL